MKRNFSICLLLSTLAVILFTGCGGKNLSIDETYSELEPVKHLELPDQITENLQIIINNVADESSSYKNRVEVFVNNNRINPDWNVSNIEKSFDYKLKVKPGYYDIKAYYYAYIGWGEERFEIISQSAIPVTHDLMTVVYYDLVKKDNGTPVNKKMYFKTQSAPLVYNTDSPQSDDSTQPAGLPSSSSFNAQTNKDVVLQINTVPENAKIIIDENVVGYAPLKISIDRNQDHVLQISAKNYKTFTKYLDKASFANQNIIRIIQELDVQ